MLFFILAIQLFSTLNAISVFYIDQQSTIDPETSDGSQDLPFLDINSAFLNANISEFTLFLVNSDSFYQFPNSFPDNCEIIIQPWP